MFLHRSVFILLSGSKTINSNDSWISSEIQPSTRCSIAFRIPRAEPAERVAEVELTQKNGPSKGECLT